MLQVRLIRFPKSDFNVLAYLFVLRYLYNVGSHPWLWRGIKISKRRFSEVNTEYIYK